MARRAPAARAGETRRRTRRHARASEREDAGAVTRASARPRAAALDAAMRATRCGVASVNVSETSRLSNRQRADALLGVTSSALTTRTYNRSTGVAFSRSSCAKELATASMVPHGENASALTEVG